MKIPVFHDDQHGTAIIVGAAVTNGLKVNGKKIGEVKLVVSGAGAAALACLDLLLELGCGARTSGHRPGRRGLRGPQGADGRRTRSRFAQKTARTLADVIGGADVFLGLSAGGVLKQDMVKEDGAQAADLALANPDARDPCPRGAKEVRPDAIICHRPFRLPQPGQQRPVLPVHLSRRARCGRHRRSRARWKSPPCTRSPNWRRPNKRDGGRAYGHEDLSFGPEYLIPSRSIRA
jgi:malate dehydrogenase (oxaloacetate-decarboxylating)(NADP+)